MLFSYVMGVDDSILELEKENFKIEKSNNDFLVEFDETKCNIWEDYIKSKLNVDFWNEYLDVLKQDGQIRTYTPMIKGRLPYTLKQAKIMLILIII